jgi:hypothetical protein
MFTWIKRFIYGYNIDSNAMKLESLGFKINRLESDKIEFLKLNNMNFTNYENKRSILQAKLRTLNLQKLIRECDDDIFILTDEYAEIYKTMN